MEQSLPGDGIKIFLKVHKTTVNFRIAMMCLLNDGLEFEDVIIGLVPRLESNLSSSSKLPLLKLPRELQMDHSIEFRKRVAHHDCLVVVGLNTTA